MNTKQLNTTPPKKFNPLARPEKKTASKSAAQPATAPKLNEK